jgi:flagellar export protein FliJ
MSRAFRLAAVERLRVRRLEDAGRALARAHTTLLEATARRDLLCERLLGCLPSGSEPGQAQTVAERRALLRDRLATADAEIAELTARADTARQGWLAARGDLRAVQALHERFRRAMRAEQDRREQRLADDLAAGRHRDQFAEGSETT